MTPPSASSAIMAAMISQANATKNGLCLTGAMPPTNPTRAVAATNAPMNVPASQVHGSKRCVIQGSERSASDIEIVKGLVSTQVSNFKENKQSQRASGALHKKKCGRALSWYQGEPLTREQHKCRAGSEVKNASCRPHQQCMLFFLYLKTCHVDVVLSAPACRLCSVWSCKITVAPLPFSMEREMTASRGAPSTDCCSHIVPMTKAPMPVTM